MILLCLWPLAEARPEQNSKMTPCFGPEGKCLEVIAREIASARVSVLVQAYVF